MNCTIPYPLWDSRVPLNMLNECFVLPCSTVFFSASYISIYLAMKHESNLPLFLFWPLYSPLNPFSSSLNNIRLSPQARPSHYPPLPFPFSLSASSLALLFTEPNNTLQCFHHQQSVFPWHCGDFFFPVQQIHFSSSCSPSHTDLCWTKHIWEDGSLASFFHQTSKTL